MRKDRLIKQLEKKQNILMKSRELNLAYQVQKSIIQIKEQSMFAVFHKDPQKTLFFVESKNPIEEIVVSTRMRYCSSCGNYFPSPHKTNNPKCILCKIRSGSFEEARRDLELYTISDIKKDEK